MRQRRFATFGLIACALAAAAGFWALSQATVATWLAREAQLRERDWQAGRSPWHWRFDHRDSIVRGGSVGLAQARIEDGLLKITASANGLVDLSLPLRGERIALGTVDTARLSLQASAPVRVLLLPHLGPSRPVWAEGALPAGRKTLALHPAALSGDIATGLQLRIETRPGTTLALRELALLAPPCPTPVPCPPPRNAPDMRTPEALLHWRDTIRAAEPATSPVASGRFGRLGDALAQWPVPPAWPWALLLLIASALGLYRRYHGITAPSRWRNAFELGLPLILTLAALLAGWPAHDTPWQASAWLGLCLAALALPPAPARLPRWHWRGGRAAWRSAALFTAGALVLLLLIHGLSHTAPRGPHDATRFLRYPLWSLVQQWLLMAVIVPRLHAFIAPRAPLALAAGLVFGMMHAPNFTLMLATAGGGTAWAWLGLRHRALLPLVASHAVLGLCLLWLVPASLLRSAEIGGRYLMAP